MEKIWIEWLILADAAQVMGNKLYLLGGGWDVLTANNPLPIQHPLSIAVAVRVPWNEANRRHNLEIEIMTGDGKSSTKVAGQFEVGRPAGTLPGQDQRVQLAFNAMIKLESQGEYVVIGRLEGQEDRRVPFRVVEGPGTRLKRAA